MAEVESAEEFVYHLDALSSSTQAKLVEARDTAIRDAAKLELLEELRTEAARLHDNCAVGRPSAAEAYCAAHTVLVAKYGAAKEPG